MDCNTFDQVSYENSREKIRRVTYDTAFGDDESGKTGNLITAQLEACEHQVQPVALLANRLQPSHESCCRYP